MSDKGLIKSVAELVRYYQAGILNTAVGYGLVVILLAVGLNVYVAQLIAHVLGVAFNYFTYSRHTFRAQDSSKLRFVLAYVVNYFLGLAALAATLQVIESPYIAGFIAILVVSAVNYVILKQFVFTRRAAS